MKTESIKISKAMNGFIITKSKGVLIARTKGEACREIAGLLGEILPKEMDNTIELEITLKD